MSYQLDRLEIGCGYVYLNDRRLHATHPGCDCDEALVAKIANEQLALLNKRADEFKIPFELIDHRDGFANRQKNYRNN